MQYTYFPPNENTYVAQDSVDTQVFDELVPADVAFSWQNVSPQTK